MKIVIVGNGVWGHALASVLKNNTTDVEIAKKGESISADAVVFALPTKAIRSVIPLIHFQNSGGIVINTSKGIEKTTHLFPHEIVEETLGSSVTYFTLMGPSFAEEVSAKMPTIVNLGYTTLDSTMYEFQKLFETPYFHVRPTKGVEALEIAGALKNVYAIGCGLSEGLGFKANTKSQLLVMALEELQMLYKALNVTVDGFALPETVGDVILTCSSTNSRNYTFGTLLASYPVAESLEKIGSTVEGYETIGSVAYLEERAKTILPFAHFIASVVQNTSKKSVREQFETFLQSFS